jgi:hypothetical protein
VDISSTYATQDAATFITPGVGVSSQIPLQPDGSPPLEAAIRAAEDRARFALTRGDVYVYDSQPAPSSTKSLSVDMANTIFGLGDPANGVVTFKYSDADVDVEFSLSVGGIKPASAPTWPGTRCRVTSGFFTSLGFSNRPFHC